MPSSLGCPPAVALREITADTVRAICALEPHDTQKGFVAPNAVSIAQAHFNAAAQFRAICADETPVGFLMWRPGDNADTVFLWRFMIDRCHQGCGYGSAALRLWLAEMSTRGIALVETSYVAGDAGPRDFYRAMGFIGSGDRKPNGEWPMTLSLRP